VREAGLEYDDALDLDGAEDPEDVAEILRAAADDYREQAQESGDPIWGRIASLLEDAAEKVEKLCEATIS
jgi:hypothetical protein